MEPRFTRTEFHHTFSHRVRSHECDRQSVVHNARYLEILEVARIEYCRDQLEMPMDSDTFVTHDKFVFVRNVIDYFSPARFDDLLKVKTRVSLIGNTSVTFEQAIVLGDRTIVEAEAVMVSLDERSNLPRPISDALRERAMKNRSR